MNLPLSLVRGGGEDKEVEPCQPHSLGTLCLQQGLELSGDTSFYGQAQEPVYKVRLCSHTERLYTGGCGGTIPLQSAPVLFLQVSDQLRFLCSLCKGALSPP